MSTSRCFSDILILWTFVWFGIGFVRWSEHDSDDGLQMVDIVRIELLQVNLLPFLPHVNTIRDVFSSTCLFGGSGDL